MAKKGLGRIIGSATGSHNNQHQVNGDQQQQNGRRPGEHSIKVLPTMAWAADPSFSLPQSPATHPSKKATSSSSTVDIKRKPKYSSGWKEFAKNSTCAAISHLGEDGPVLCKVLWLFIACLGLAITVVTTYESTISVLRGAVVTEMFVNETSNDHGQFEYPEFHLCTTNIFNEEALKELGFKDNEMISYLLMALSILSPSPTILKDENRLNQLQDRFEKIIGNRSIQDVVRQTLLKCDEIVAGCIGMNDFMDSAECCAGFFKSRSFPAWNAACVSTHDTESQYQPLPTMAFGFVVFLWNRRQSYQLENSIIHPLYANQRGVFYSASDRWTDPYVALTSERHLAKPGQWVNLPISKTTLNDGDVMNSYLADHKCVNREEADHQRFKHLIPRIKFYTESNCKMAQRYAVMSQSVDCTPINLINLNDNAGDDDNVTVCNPKDLALLTNKSRSNIFNKNGADIRRLTSQTFGDCARDCVKDSYTFVATYMDLELTPNFSFGNWSFLPNNSDELVALNFFYPSFTTTHMVNHYPTINQWLGVVGGNFGLFLGASMIALIELILFFGYQLYRMLIPA